MKLQQGNKLSGDRTLSRQTFWVTIEMTIIQDSVAIRTRIELLSRQEQLGRDTNLKKQLNITAATEIQGRLQETSPDIRLLTATETCNEIQNYVTIELSGRD